MRSLTNSQLHDWPSHSNSIIENEKNYILYTDFTSMKLMQVGALSGIE